MSDIRYDKAVELPAVRREDNGWIRVDGRFTRAGIFIYRNPDGTERRELRPVSEVLDPASLETFAAIPVTDDHPADLLNADNTSDYAKGSVLTVRGDGEYLVGTLRVTDKKLISKMERGKQAVSVGYTVDYKPTPGVDPVFGRYDGIQTKIRANHLAVVDAGRAGPDARVRMDNLTEISTTAIDSNQINDSLSPVKGLNLMLSNQESEHILAANKAVEEVTIRADKAEADLKTASEKLAEETKRADAATGKAEELEAQNKKLAERLDVLKDQEKLVAEIAALKARLVEVDAARRGAEDPKRFHAAVRERARLESAAVAILGDKARLDLDDNELMVSVIQHVSGAVKADASREYLKARFDAAVDSHAVSVKSLAKIREVARKDAEQAPRSRDAARQEMINRYRNREGK